MPSRPGDYLSLHTYYNNNEEDTPNFLARSLDMDLFINSVATTCDYIQAKKKSKKKINLSLDEWNVWKSQGSSRAEKRWQIAPPEFEDVYTLEDALVVGCCLITVLKHVDRVKMACIAQLINVIAPIMTENGGPLWLQSTYYSYLHASLYGRGTVLHPLVSSPKYDSKDFSDVPYLEVISVYNEEQNEVTVFAVNCHLSEGLELDVDLRSFSSVNIIEHIKLEHEDIKAVNTKSNPHNVMPSQGKATVEGGHVKALIIKIVADCFGNS